MVVISILANQHAAPRKLVQVGRQKSSLELKVIGSVQLA